jgi:adenylate cyclase
MSEVFISYARSTASQAKEVANALRVLGYSVWRDDDLPAHRSYADVIDERLRSAKAVVVIWSAEALKSQWVRAEADVARKAGTLVQLNIDGTIPPLPFDQIQCAEMNGWSGDTDAPGWRKIVASITDLIGGRASSKGPPAEPSSSLTEKLSICVLPFANMSDDPQQEYFSDGISEDIITDLSKVSALAVIARNTAFTYKGKSVEVPQIARHLRVSHVLEGSVRKAGGRVRITAQLIDGVSGSHIWAERYDRDLNNIFALQDEISEAIVKALKLKLLPEEKKAIEKRGTESVAAYGLYLMARQMSITGNAGNARNHESIVRLCRRATEIDPKYARAWALMAGSQTSLRLHIGRDGENGLAAAERAIGLDPDLAEAHAARAVVLTINAQYDEAWREAEIALRLDPESYEVNHSAGRWSYAKHRFNDAIRYWEKAARIIETDYHSSGMLINCYKMIGDPEGSCRAAERTLARAEMTVAKEPDNGSAMSFGILALATLGQTERAKEWTERAVLLDPDNLNMHFNVACCLIVNLGEKDAALNILERLANEVNVEALNWWKIDPDLNPIRDHPRFRALMATAEARVDAEAVVAPSSAS